MGSDPHGLWILGISVVTLVLGPLIHRLARREPATMAALDNFVLVAVVGLVALEIVPGALHLAGPGAFLALLLGALGPLLADGLAVGPLHRAARGTHGAALVLAIVGMALHSFTDGLALASAHAAGSHSHALEAAVIAHQLPVAVAVWWLLSPVGTLRASAAMVGLGVATIAGFMLADGSLAALTPGWLGVLQGLFAGFLLHVIAHRSGPLDPRSQNPRRLHIAAALGGLAGVGLLVLLAQDAGHGHADDPIARLLADLVGLARGAAPVLLTALVVAVGIGRPLRLRLARSEPDPELDLDLAGESLTNQPSGPLAGQQSGPLPGPLAGSLAGSLAGPLAGSRTGPSGGPLGNPLTDPPGPSQSSSGAHRSHAHGSRSGHRLRRLGPRRRGLLAQYDHAAPWFTVGLLMAAMLQPFLGPSPLPQIGPVLQVLLLAVLGVPAHVFMPAATPLIALLIPAGLGPGAALAFVLSGPATELGAHRRSRKLARTLMALALVAAISLGLLLDLLAAPDLKTGATAPPAPYGDLALIALAGLLLANLVRQTPQQFLRRLWHREGPGHAHAHNHAHNHAHSHDPPAP